MSSGKGSKISVVIFPGYYVPHLGGQETHVDEFACHLSQDPRFEVCVFAPHLPSTAPAEEKRHGRVRVVRYPAWEPVTNYPLPRLWHPAFWKAYLALFQAPLDVVMTRTRFFSNALLGLFLARVRGKKLVHVEHGSAFVQLHSPWKTRLARYYDLSLGRLVVQQADLVVAISEAVRAFLKAHFLPGGQIPVIYRGLDFEKLAAAEPHPWVLDHFPHHVRLGFVGRLLKWKGVENLLQAFFELPEAMRERCVLLIVGDGEEAPRLRALAARRAGNVVFFGARPFQEALAVLKTCHLYVHPSYPGGGLSTSLLEAMALGRAVIASPHEGAREVVRDGQTGVLLPDNHPSEIRQALQRLIPDPATRSRLGHGARQFVHTHFSWERNIARWRELILQLLG